MLRRPPRSTRTDTLFPYTTPFRSQPDRIRAEGNLSAGTPRASITGKIVDGIAMRETPWERGILQPAAFRSRSEEHTSELQSLMRSSYAVFCLKKKNRSKHTGS